MCVILDPVMSKAMILRTYISSVPQRNRRAFPLNHDTEVSMKEQIAITYIYEVHEC
jgi:hypothetical protein